MLLSLKVWPIQGSVGQWLVDGRKMSMSTTPEGATDVESLQKKDKEKGAATGIELSL